jgi:hypothetical protein
LGDALLGGRNLVSKKWWLVGGISGGIVVLGGVAYALSRRSSGNPILMIEADTSLGTVDPAVGTHTEYGLNSSIPITAIPNDPSYEPVWRINGVELNTHPQTYSLTLTGDTTVIISFVSSNPIVYPASLLSLGDVTMIQNVGVWNDSTGTPNTIRVKHVDENWDKAENYCTTMLQFKVLASDGVTGVPDVPVAVWPQTNPDTGRYKGITLINKNLFDAEVPYIVKSDSSGVVLVPLNYRYGYTDGFYQMCEDVDVGFWCMMGVFPSGFIAQDGWQDPFCSILYGGHGDCQTGNAGCEKMGILSPNTIIAQVVGSPNLIALGRSYSGFHVKWA